MKAELIDCMGSDLTVVNAARVSFNKESEWEEEEFVGEDTHGIYQDYKLILADKDQKLIKYLAKHGHWTPFAHAQITMRETVPIFVARQRFKHQIGFVYNEVSRRYVDEPPTFYFPDKWRGKAENKKQGSSSEVITEMLFQGIEETWVDDVNAFYTNFLSDARSFYRDMIAAGIAPEQARMVLPQSIYTSYYVTGSLAAWARAYKLRSSSDAQMEIQELAAQWNDIIRPLFPHSWEALTG